MTERPTGTTVSRRSPNQLGWASASTNAQLDRQAKLFVAIFILIGCNIFLDSGSAPFAPGFVRWLGVILVGSGMAMGGIFLRTGDLGLKGTADKQEGPRVNRLNATLFLVLIGISSLVLVTVVASTGGPLVSPFGQYLIAELLLAQLLAPTVQAAWSAFGSAAVLFTVAEVPIWVRWISGIRLVWPSLHYLTPIVVTAIASTWVNVSTVAIDARNRRTESVELVRAQAVGEPGS
jgi:hypothetical protein